MSRKLLLQLFALVACLLCSMSAAAAEAYACYTSGNTTLTFYYDTQRSSRSGTTYGLNTGSSAPGWKTDGTNANVTQVVFNSSFAGARPTSTYYWFAGMTNLTSITGLSYLNTSEVTNMADMFSYCSPLTTLNLSSFNTSKVTDMHGMFKGCSHLMVLNKSGWNTSNVTNMKEMFYMCSSLSSLDLSSFNTGNVTDMNGMFGGCLGLSILDLSSFNTSKVTDMINMFSICSNLTTIYAGSGWTTNAVTQSSNMFYNCTRLRGGMGTTWNSSNPTDKTYAHIDGGTANPGYLTDINEPYVCYTSNNTTLTFYYDNKKSSRSGQVYDIDPESADPAWMVDGVSADVTKVVFDSSFEYYRPTNTCEWFCDMEGLQSIAGFYYLHTERVTDMTAMFAHCKSLSSLDLSHFNTANVLAMSSMFWNCTGLTSLDLSGFLTSNVINMSHMFEGCSNLTTIYVGDGWLTYAVNSSNDMFRACTSLVGGKGTTYSSSHIDKAYAHIDGGTSNPGYLTAPLEAYACYTPSNTTLTFYYDSDRSSRSGTIYDLNTGSIWPGWYTGGTNSSVTKVVFDPRFANARPTTTNRWFCGMTNLTSITGMKQYLNTSSVTDMCGMFSGCRGLTSLDVSGFNTAMVTDMSSMFSGCLGLTSLDVSGFNTAMVTDMGSMFYDCRGLTSLDVSGFNTAKVTDMSSMFGYCAGLTSFDVSSFNTANVTNMYDMFEFCARLTSLDLSCFNTSKVTNMSGMFGFCSGLTSLDVSGFNTSKVTDMGSMFSYCSALTTIYAGGGWTTDAVISSIDMFRACTSLVGGMGTTYNSSHTDATYARIDGGTSNPGYFTALIEAYACYTPSNTTLTFYYDNQRSSRTGTTYDLSDATFYPGWYTDSTCRSVTQVVFNSSFNFAQPTSTRAWFADMRNLTSITDLFYLHTENVTTMLAMFYNCDKLTSLDVTRFNTANVTSMNYMFRNCSGLTSLDLSNFNTSKVTNMSYMFYGCSNLTTIYADSGWTTDAVTQSTNMFSSCTKLVGGMGTTFNSNHVDATYAHIDGGTSNPGYFTAPPEAYACYTPSNTTLTFYYDNYRSSRTGTTYDLNDATFYPGWYTDSTCRSVTQVVFSSSFNFAQPTSTRAWFADMRNLTSITGLFYLHTENVTTMLAMFYNCDKLTSLDVTRFNTANVTSMNYMFRNCSGLTSLDLSNFNTSKVTNMSYMFYGCSNLTTIYAGSGWTTDAVTQSTNMFSSCTKLVGGMGTTFNSNHVDATYARIDGGTSNPGYFTASPEAYACYTPSNTTLTFYYDNYRSSRSGTTYDLNDGSSVPGWRSDGTNANVTKVVFNPSFANARPTSTYQWFSSMTNLTSITGLSYLNTENVTTMQSMFFNCKKLTSLDVSGFNTSNVINMVCMFSGCSGLTSLDLSSFNTSKVTNMMYMFYECTNLTTIYAGSGWTTNAVTSSGSMFYSCTSLVGGMGTTYDASHTNKAYAHIDGGPSNPGYFTVPPEAYACYTPSNTTLTFYYDSQRSSREGTTYDLNTGNSVPGWRSDGTNANVTNVVILPSFADARPTSTYYWFTAMRNLTSITGLSYLNTENVTTMMSMFSGCSGLTSLDVSHFNTAQVTNMGLMFYQCSGLTSLDLSDFNTSQVTNMIYMFNGCSNLTTIYAGSGWTTASSSGNMFYNCTSLVGGMGTTYDANHVDGEYAHIDWGPSNPGYFSEKPAYMRGDVNGDGSVTIIDVTAMIDYLLTGNSTGIDMSAADVNQDSDVTIIDVTALIDYLLTGSW